MKKTVYYFRAIFLALFVGGIASVAFGQNDPFITVWKTDNNGTSGNDSIMIPATGDYTYDWVKLDGAGNPTSTTGNGNGTDVEYLDFDGNGVGVYRVSISPDNSNATPFSQIEFNNSDDKDKIININQWGDIAWTSFENAYYGADSLTISATDTLDLSGVTDMSFAFASTNLDSIPGTNGWDVSNIDNMEGLFYKASAFNGNIVDWDVSSVTVMDSMFFDAANFNQNIGDWDVSQVSGMAGIFKNASNFDRSLEKWDLQSLVGSFSFSNSDMSCENYSSTLHGWLFNPNVPDDIVVNAQGCQHSSEVNTDKMLLDTEHNWTIKNDFTGICGGIVRDGYITVWKTDNAGTSASDEIMIPATGDYDLYWAALDASGDSTGVIGLVKGSGVQTFNFDGNGPGKYRVKMVPMGANSFNRIHFADADDKDKILAIEQWGETEWSSMEEAYWGASNLTVTATDSPILDSLTNMKYAFSETTLPSISAINNWDVSTVTNLSYMFKDAANFNSDIGQWNVSNVTDMTFMFEGASSFNDTISDWDISSVTDLEGMFLNATSYNSPLNTWNVSNVTNMNSLFMGASDFNQRIIDWDVRNVTDMENILTDASSFNHDLGSWNLNSLTGIISIDNTAMDCDNYTLTLFGWSNISSTPSNITLDADGCSYSTDATSVRNNLINNFGWTINNDTQGSCSAVVANPYVTLWKSDNTGLSNNNEIIIPARGQFIYKWEEDGNSSNSGGGTAKDELTITFPSPGTYQVSIFPVQHNSIDFIKFNNGGDKDKILEIKAWGDIQWGIMKTSYLGASNLEITATDSPDLSNLTDMEYAFGFTNMATIQNLENWDVSNVTNMKYLFYNMSNFNQDISSWDVSNVENMSYMFAKASSFNQPVGSWDVSNVTKMSKIFDEASAFDQSLEDWKLRNLSGDISLAYSGMSCQNYSRSLRSWAQDTLTVENFTIFVNDLEYGPGAEFYRQELIDSSFWMIYGDELGNCSLGVNEYTAQNFTVYPNPTESKINVDGLQGNETIELRDMTGRVLQTVKDNNKSVQLNINNLSNGMYNLIIISKNGQVVNKKVIKE